MSRRRKWIVWLSVVGAGVGLIYLLFRDESPPDVSDLIVSRPIVADSDNALPALIQAAALMQWADEDGLMLSKLNDADTDALAARKLLAANTAALARAKEALSRPGMQFEAFESIAQPFLYLSDLMHLGRLQVAYAQLLYYDGEQQRALAELLETLKFGRRVQTGGGTLVHWLVGVSIETTAQSFLAEIADDPTFSSQDLLPSIAAAFAAEPDPNVFGEVMRREYQFLNNAVDLVANDPKTIANASVGVSLPTSVTALGPLFFRPNRTRRMFAEATREVITASQHSYSELEARTPRLRPYPGPFPALQLLSTNATGRVLYQITMPVYETVIKRKSEITTRRAMTATLLALRCHWLDHGTLPERLDELVPEYLPAVPLDDFDGKPLRYSREKWRLWSIGQDLIDHGGAADPDDNKQQKLEPTIALDWAK